MDIIEIMMDLASRRPLQNQAEIFHSAEMRMPEYQFPEGIEHESLPDQFFDGLITTLIKFPDC